MRRASPACKLHDASKVLPFCIAKAQQFGHIAYRVGRLLIVVSSLGCIPSLIDKTPKTDGRELGKNTQ